MCFDSHMLTKDHITDYLKFNAERFPHKLAFVCADRTFTWAELCDVVVRAASVLAPRLSADHQEIVSLYLPNSWQFVVTYLAILEAGHIALPLDATFKALELEAIIAQLPPALIITDAVGAKLFFGHVDKLLLGETLLAGDGQYESLRLPAKAQVASMLFTSGTTGKPKAAPYTHANHLWNIKASSELYEWTSDDTILLSLPLSHWHGLVMGISGAIYHGNTVWLQERMEPEATLQTLASGDITLFMHVSLAYTKLTQHNPEKTYDLSKVRLCISASSALPPSSWETFKQRFGLEILECYGSSEAGRIASNSLTDRVPGSPGRAMPGTELKISPEGDVLIKTPGLFPGYYHNDEATAKDLLPGGWWRTGDLGELDDQGHVFLKGRVQEKIKKQGYSLSPRDLEWSLQHLPGVKEVFVMGVQRPDNPSDKLVYFVVGDVDEFAIKSYCKEKMPSAWRPDTIFLLDAIPRTRSGKPILGELRILAQG
jgi:malonyl-CoA/methylmalonyl-CoA synthetase